MPKVEVHKHGELIVVHGILVNYDQTPHEATRNLPHSHPWFESEYDPAKWNGGRKGEEEVVLCLHRRDKSLSTIEARGLVRERESYPCLPADIAPLAELNAVLWEVGLWYVAVLGKSDDDLWQAPDGHKRVVFLDCNPKYLGFNFHHNVGFYHLAWFAGRLLEYRP